MDLNTISIGFMSLPILYLVYLYFTLPAAIVPEKPKFLWGEQVGRTRSIQSKNGDASMATEMSRRRAIQMVGQQSPSKIKETRTSSGSGTGAIESFFLTSICPAFCKLCKDFDIIFDGGYIESEFCPVLNNDEDGSIVYDAGGIDTIVCGV